MIEEFEGFITHIDDDTAYATLIGDKAERIKQKQVYK